MEADELYLEELRVLVEQGKIDVEFAEAGLTPELLEKQVRVNSIREEHNIVDESEIIYDEDKEVYVQ